MSVKKDLGNTPAGMVVTGLFELAKAAKAFRFEKEEGGTYRAAFPVNVSPALSGKVEIMKGPNGALSLKWMPSKTIPGQAKGKTVKKSPH
ncbi:hypothetical protein [Streptomyces lannensis]|uniref:Uncharacterized protein n=1 Tax=Streptomyces lannensis TaxID=766498 RepID=A0ABP7K692_9ACTN